MLRCVAELKSPKIGPGLLGREGFVEDTFGVSIQVVHDQCDPFAIGVPRIEQVAHLQRPVDFCPLGTGCGLSKSGQRFGEHKNTGSPVSLVFDSRHV